jgi:hypothetical protein
MKDTRETAKDYTDWMVKTGGFARDMTLRDHLAAQVAPIWATYGSGSDDEWFEKAAKAVYKMADAMLKERAK